MPEYLPNEFQVSGLSQNRRRCVMAQRMRVDLPCQPRFDRELVKAVCCVVGSQTASQVVREQIIFGCCIADRKPGAEEQDCLGPEKADPVFPSLTASDLQRADREAHVLDAQSPVF